MLVLPPVDVETADRLVVETDDIELGGRIMFLVMLVLGFELKSQELFLLFIAPLDRRELFLPRTGIEPLKEWQIVIADRSEGIVTPRILELISDIDEEEDKEQSSISFLSFKNFIYLLVKNTNVFIPSFVVTYQGNIRALWRKSRRQHLAVEFNPDETVTYVIFSPNVDRPGEIMRSSGTISQKLLFEVAFPLGANKWVCKE